MTEIHQKWGFGMAPYKPEVNQHRIAAARICMTLLAKPMLAKALDAQEEISEVKGLFSRAHRQDQWDWFTTWTRLGRPTRLRSRKLSRQLGQLRMAAVKMMCEQSVQTHAASLRELAALRCLAIFAGDLPPDSAGGQIYILSTRDQPDVLKIGYTERSVEVRVKEINQATGVLTPYGVRAAWYVESAPTIEKQIHRALAEFRIRSDREFFRLDYYHASEIITRLICRKQIEG